MQYKDVEEVYWDTVNTLNGKYNCFIDYMNEVYPKYDGTQ